MNRLWNGAVDALLSGALDPLGDPLTVRGYRYVYAPAGATVLSDLQSAAPVTAAVPLTGRTVAGRVLHAAPVTFAAVAEDDALAVIEIYHAVTGLLVAHIDQRPDLAPLAIDGNGGPVTITWGGPDGTEVFSL